MEYKPEISEVSRTLGKISEVMADGFHFLRMRALVEDWNDKANAGDEQAQEMMKTINMFHRLCVVVQNMK